MTTKQSEKLTVTIDGNEYVYDDLAQELKAHIALYEKWNNELIDAKHTVLKLELAIAELTKVITSSVKVKAAAK